MIKDDVFTKEMRLNKEESEFLINFILKPQNIVIDPKFVKALKKTDKKGFE